MLDENLIHAVDDLVVHGSPVLRVGMQKQSHRGIWSVGGVITAFQAAFRAIEIYFRHDIGEPFFTLCALNPLNDYGKKRMKLRLRNTKTHKT